LLAWVKSEDKVVSRFHGLKVEFSCRRFIEVEYNSITAQAPARSCESNRHSIPVLAVRLD
jgi:hypothetical protein